MGGGFGGGQLPPQASSFGGAAPSPLMGASATRDPRAQWASREVPVAAPPGMAPAPAEVSLPPRQSPPQQANRRQRPPQQIGRGGGRKMPVSVSLLLLVAVVGGGSWLFREPIRNAVQSFTGGAGEAVVENIPSASGDSPPATGPKATEPSTLLANEAPQPDVPGRFDPNEPSAAEFQPPGTDGLASGPDGGSGAVTVKPAQGGLMEVPSKPVEAGLKSENTPAGAPEIVIQGLPPEAEPAAEALKKFLNAANLEERLRYTLAPEMMRDYMERYYSVNPAGPVGVDTIAFVRFDAKPQMGSGAHAVFGLESRAWRYPVPVMLEGGPNGFRVDWLSFVEFKDRLLERFFKEYSEGAARFHVGLTRKHYFESDVPNADKKYAFSISSAPPNPFAATVFVDMESALGKELKEKVPWGAQVWAIAELEWMRLGTHQWVELAAVPQLNWYSVPTSASSSAAQPARSPATPTQIQRAVPIGR